MHLALQHVNEGNDEEECENAGQRSYVYEYAWPLSLSLHQTLTHGPSPLDNWA